MSVIDANYLFIRLSFSKYDINRLTIGNNIDELTNIIINIEVLLVNSFKNSQLSIIFQGNKHILSIKLEVSKQKKRKGLVISSLFFIYNLMVFHPNSIFFKKENGTSFKKSKWLFLTSKNLF